MASAMAGMTGFGWGADAIGHAASLAGLGLVLVLTAAVAVPCGHKACILLRGEHERVCTS